MNINSEELEKYLQSSLSAIKNGIEGSGDFCIIEPIEFDLAVINTKEGGGSIKIYIAKAEGNLKSEEISHIKIKVHPDIRKEAKVFQPYQKNTYI
ncbi:MAG: hypothetical protein A3H01_00750 [Candidatus Wildermuthbacteria bacterium RIFCSPLOWO2_12_FULL_40_9]|uniref:Uncharacterized protein n=2 Tax=Candidatus Wildermuthiibacteriota TaxID=1817923 RepID=A0A1G2RC55_9BACT|nr:MAG: hypothetical protein A3F15_02670 [Candidatus Wildermuthbacteria bacterium RIFCSPHIGHO2_12_FULL_40_12]OHA76793.1 MAG: hypothetical protein A3H01_00750 [Candidatus Wildermuthbacteria bacterium RIFCSPLOWO2_12_FULL_40_9]